MRIVPASKEAPALNLNRMPSRAAVDVAFITVGDRALVSQEPILFTVDLKL